MEENTGLFYCQDLCVGNGLMVCTEVNVFQFSIEQLNNINVLSVQFNFKYIGRLCSTSTQLLVHIN